MALPLARRTRLGAVAAFVALGALGASCGMAPTTTPVAATVAPVGEWVNGASGPVLGATHGWQVVLAADSTVFTVDLDTGRITTGALPQTFGPPVLRVPSAPLVWTQADPVKGQPASQATLEERDLSGVVTRTRTVVIDNEDEGFATDATFQGAVGEELVISAHGRIVLVDANSGAPRAWADGVVKAVGGNRIVWRECTSPTTCDTYAGTATQPHATRLPNVRTDCDPGFEGQVERFGCPTAVSADGRFLLATEYGAADGYAVRRWDLRAATSVPIVWPRPILRAQINTGQTWGVGDLLLSPDGSWVFAMQPTGRISALEVASGRFVEFDVVAPMTGTDFANVVRGFAVG